MSTKITQPLPIDANDKPIQTAPVGVALAVTYDSSMNTATNVTLNASTTYIEVSAVLKGLFLRWGATATSSAFDEYITAEQTRGFGIPDGITVVSFIEEAASAHLVLVEK